MGSIVLTAPEFVHTRDPSTSTMVTPASDRADQPHHNNRSSHSTSRTPSTTSSHARNTPTETADRPRASGDSRSPAPPPSNAPSNTSTVDQQQTPQHGTHAPATVSPTSDSTISPRLTQATAQSSATSSPRIQIKDLNHIQSFCADPNSPMAYLQSPNNSTTGPSEGDAQPPQYEISNMPVSDVIEMVAGLLTKITTTNDSQAEQLHRNIPTGPEAAAGMSAQTSSVLAFHGKNVPTISIMSYLSRIHKYCPATYEVFLSLLVYFDRITEKVNSAPLQAVRKHEDEAMKDSSGSVNEGRDSKHAENAAAGSDASTPGSPETASDRPASSSLPSPPLTDFDPMSLAHFFVVDSYNIHRLVIAGVTCASKFFSDVFYTNSRYAKVGGLPLVELNHLELQFLILNDFRLSIAVEELEAYGTMLVEFYAREVLAQRQEDNMEGVEAAS